MNSCTVFLTFFMFSIIHVQLVIFHSLNRVNLISYLFHFSLSFQDFQHLISLQRQFFWSFYQPQYPPTDTSSPAILQGSSFLIYPQDLQSGRDKVSFILQQLLLEPHTNIWEHSVLFCSMSRPGGLSLFLYQDLSIRYLPATDCSWLQWSTHWPDA